MENNETSVNGYKQEYVGGNDNYSTMLDDGRCYDGFYPDVEEVEIKPKIEIKEFVPEELEYAEVINNDAGSIDNEVESSGVVLLPGWFG